jgi:hypothetical protein
MSNTVNKVEGSKVVVVVYEIPNDLPEARVFTSIEKAEEDVKLWMIGVASEHPEIIADIREFGIRDPDVLADFSVATKCYYGIDKTTIL